MKNAPTLSAAEWEVMHVVWDHHPVTAQEVAEGLGPRRKRSLATVKTLLARLLKKGVVDFDLEGKRYLYRPIVSRERCVRGESETFLERVFEGSTSPLVAHFLERGKLSPAEIRKLRDLLRDLERGR